MNFYKVSFLTLDQKYYVERHNSYVIISRQFLQDVHLIFYFANKDSTIQAFHPESGDR